MTSDRPLKVRHVVFDFDGTLCDSLPSMIVRFNLLAAKRGFRPMSEEHIERMRPMTPRDRVRFLGVRWYQIPGVARHMRETWQADLHKMRCFSGIPELLFSLRDRGIQIGVISSNSAENIREFARQQQLPEFTDIRSTDLFGKHRALRRYLSQHKVSANEVIYVGDETRDAEACRRISLPFVGVTWGADKPEAFASFAPRAVVDRAADLQALLLSHA